MVKWRYGLFIHWTGLFFGRGTYPAILRVTLGFALLAVLGEPYWVLWMRSGLAACKASALYLLYDLSSPVVAFIFIISSYAQGLLLALCLGIIPDGVKGTVFGAGDQA